jgi:hypothetical protein
VHSGTPGSENQRSSLVVKVAAGGVLLIATVALVAIGLSRMFWVDLYLFALPGLVMVGIVGRSLFVSGLPTHTTGSSIIGATWPYLIGAAVPVVAFAAYFAAMGAFSDLLRDVLFVSATSFEGAALKPASPYGLIATALAVFVVIDIGRGHISILQQAIAVAVMALMLLPTSALVIEPMVWASLAEATPAVILLLMVVTVRAEKRVAEPTVRSRLVLMGCVAAFCSLVQYPFAAPIYFSYSLPLMLLAIVALIPELKFVRRRALNGLACAYMVFGALYIAPMKLPGIRGPVIQEDVAILDLPRGGLRIPRLDAETYAQTVQLLKSHTTSGVTYAGPDAPDLYFLAELQNPTPTMFDYQSPDPLFHQHLLERLGSLGVNAVALRRRPVHSPPLRPEVLAQFEAKYPFSQMVGRFTVRWR